MISYVTMFLAAEIIYVLLKNEAEGHKTERRYFLCFHMKKGTKFIFFSQMISRRNQQHLCLPIRL